MTKKVSREDLKYIMGSIVYYSANGLVADTVEAVIEDVLNGEDVDEAVDDEVDNTLDYDSNIWKLLKCYQKATEVNYDRMVEEFHNIVSVCVNDYLNEFGSEDE